MPVGSPAWAKRIASARPSGPATATTVLVVPKSIPMLKSVALPRLPPMTRRSPIS
jgi:hypothetical protein